jgi:FKBP-type peptidyl-prolyl cis-trans isomerase
MTGVALRVPIVLLLTFVFGGCQPDRPAEDPGEPLPPFAPELNVEPRAMSRTPTGLRIRDLEEGTGDPASAGDHVSVHYTGWLPDGTEFDSSRGGPPFEFPLGQGMVIPGWDEGVAGMRPGGRRQLVIPPDLAYGPSGYAVIPPNATLVFDVELLEVRSR